MKRLTVILFVCLVAIVPLSAQYVDKISEFTQQGVGFDMSNARSSAAFLDWSKVQMNHSVSMSMGTSVMGAESYLTYHNEFYMPLSSRLSFYGNLYWQLQAYASNPALQRLNNPAGEIYFDANFVYKLSDNSTLSLGFARYPSIYGNMYNMPGDLNYPYYGYNPFYFNTYRRGLNP
ncbi:MAG: hypothetical protein U9O95_00290 [Candidatus Marinimicrobia bacterium]|nr:hypothetical protein [Candidatus Neomarinimicrobiota bacterium]